jgi:hypothetical protein
MISEGELEVLVVHPNQQDHKQDEEEEELNKAASLFSMIHFIHSDAKKHRFWAN